MKPGAQTRMATHLNAVKSEKPVPELIEELERGRLDAILAPYPYGGQLKEAISHQVLFREPLVIVAGRSLTVGASWAALAKAAWILPPPHFLVRRSVEARFLTSGQIPPSPIIESFSVTTNLQLAVHGHGVAALPECVMLEAEAAGASGGFR